MPSTAKKSSQTLIVLHGNRYIEVFGSDRHPVKIIAVPFAETPKDEILIEELILQRLPPSWQDTYAECNLSDRDAIKPVEVIDLAVKDFDIDVLNTFKKHEVRK